MKSICRFELCELAAEIISKEFNTPNLTLVDGKTADHEKARYFYVYFCHTQLDASFLLIRKTMPVYKYPKTVYQVFKRAYERRKENENKFLLSWMKSEFDRRIEQYKSQNFMIRNEGKQINLFAS
jgi:hypothetical protein